MKKFTCFTLVLMLILSLGSMAMAAWNPNLGNDLDGEGKTLDVTVQFAQRARIDIFNDSASLDFGSLNGEKGIYYNDGPSLLTALEELIGDLEEGERPEAQVFGGDPGHNLSSVRVFANTPVNVTFSVDGSNWMPNTVPTVFGIWNRDLGLPSSLGYDKTYAASHKGGEYVEWMGLNATNYSNTQTIFQDYAACTPTQYDIPFGFYLSEICNVEADKPYTATITVTVVAAP